MYYNFYQLRENPFNMTADPSFFYSSKHHAEAVSHLAYGIEQRKGIMVVTGEIGTGKTTLCRKLLNQKNDSLHTAFILNPSFSEVQLLQAILQDLGIMTSSKSRFDLLTELNRFLIAERQKNRNVVLLLDEAQNLSTSQLEQVRLLSNLETTKEKLLQIILMGQPELREKLELPKLRQLRQRISVYYHLNPLTKEDILAYIQHRLKIAAGGLSPRIPIFSDMAVEKIYSYTRGSPRTINILCDRALTAGFVAGTRSINENIIEHCAREVMYCEHHS